MGGYWEKASEFLKESKNKGILGDIAKVSLIVYTILLFGVPLSVGKFPLPTPEQIVFIVLTYAVFVGKGVGFLRDLAPLVILFFAYEAMRGVVVGNEQRVITQYWSSSQSMNGLEVIATPSMCNIGDPLTIEVKSQEGNVGYVNVWVSKIGGVYQKNEMAKFKLEQGIGSYAVSEAKSRDVFGEEGVYNLTASAANDPAINGSSVVGITRNVHYREPVMWEKAIFGFVPSAYLQKQLYRQGQVSAIDLIAVIAYCMHFIAPFLFASIVWFEDGELYRRYSASFIILSYAGLVTFLFYPAAPPWLASLVGYTSGVKKIYDEISLVLNLVILPGVYYLLNANEVAAIPSLHFAFPLLIAIFSARLWGRKGWLVFLYPLVTAFSLVYLGEHYFVDIIIGFFYTLAAILVVELILRKWGSGKKGSHYKQKRNK